MAMSVAMPVSAMVPVLPAPSLGGISILCASLAPVSHSRIILDIVPILLAILRVS